MTHDELNTKLAEAMVWADWRYEEPMMIGPAGFPVPFSPATSSDHLRMYVYPEIERRGHLAWCHFIDAQESLGLPRDCSTGMNQPGFTRFLLTADPAILAEAALKVLKGGGK